MRTQREQEEARKNRVYGALFTLLCAVVMVFLAFYLVIWSPPDPPIPEYGIEVNFGMSDFGSGEKQHRTKTSPKKSKAVPKSKSPAPKKAVYKPTPKPSTPKVKPANQPKARPVADAESEVAVDPIESTPKRPVEPKAQKPKPTKDAPKQQKQTAAKPVKNEAEAVPEKTVNSEALLPNSNQSSDQGQPTNQGDTQKAGDQGDKKGKVDADALLGASTGKAGVALDMPGWAWESPPEVVDNSGDTGKLVFEIKIDERGEVIGVKTVYRSVSKSVANAYQRAIERLIFIPKAHGYARAGITTGKITFRIVQK